MTDTPTPPFEREVNRLVFKLRLLTGVSASLTAATFSLFVLGLIVLILRAVTHGTNRQLMMLGLIPVFASALAGILYAQRRAPGSKAVRALLDRQNRCGGLLMAAAQTDLGKWRESIPALVQPRLRWHGRRRMVLFSVAVLFVAACFIAPVQLGAAGPDQLLDIGKESQQIAGDIEILKNEEIIDQSRVESLEKELASIQSDAKGEDPAKTWEALDHLNGDLSDTAAAAAEKMAQTSEALGKAEALAKALAEGGSAMDSKLATEAMKELSQLASDAASAGALSKDGVSEDTLAALKSGSLSSKQLKELASALGSRKGELAKSLGTLREANLIDLRTYKKCEGAGGVDSEGLAAFLAENAENMPVADAMSLWGKGGISRGRGDAPMTWSDGTREDGARFKTQVIPPSVVADLKDSQLVGRGVGAPSIQRGGPATSGALNGAASGGGSAFTQTILPRHKGTVKRYFER